jgi:hypothetical protein
MNIKTKISKFDSIDCGCGEFVLLNDDLDKKYSNGTYKKKFKIKLKISKKKIALKLGSSDLKKVSELL